MRRWLIVALCAWAAPVWAEPALLTGNVVGEDLRPLPGAAVEVTGTACAAVTDVGGTFRLRCDGTGLRQVRAWAEGRAVRIQEVELGPDRFVELHFLLARPMVPVAAQPAVTGLEAPLANPLLTTWGGFPITLRALGIVLAAGGFLLGFLAMRVVARGLGLVVQRRALSSSEVADLVMNAGKVSTERVRPVAVTGATGASYSLSYGVDELAAAYAAGAHGWIALALLPPLLVAVAGVGFALALLVGQPRWLFGAMLLVPLGFLVTPIIIVVKARQQARRGLTS
jgi:hypothetical protein